MNETECRTGCFKFEGQNGTDVVGKFDGGLLTSEAGSLLVREVEKRLGILNRFSDCFEDHRDRRFTQHTVEELVSQRVYGLVCGHEDLNDHDFLRTDPVFQILVGKANEILAGKSRLNRLELTTEVISKYKKIYCHTEQVERLLLDVFLESLPRRVRRGREQLILDLDATDITLFGNQEGKFFHGYYGDYCYLPLYIFCGDPLLAARLRRSNIDGSEGAKEELERIVAAIRKEIPQAQIILRADSGFAREELMRWCEEQGVDYLFGLARNARLTGEIEKEMQSAELSFKRTERAARIFKEFRYQTIDSWSRSRRVIAKAEYLEKGPNPRFIVTSLPKNAASAMELYEDWYCKRGDMENRIKE